MRIIHIMKSVFNHFLLFMFSGKVKKIKADDGFGSRLIGFKLEIL